MHEFRAIRYDEAGQVDDVAITCDMFRLEMLDDNLLWAAAHVETPYGVKTVMFYISATEDGKIHINAVSDELGCIDDSVNG